MVNFLQKKILKRKILIKLTIFFTILTGIIFGTIISNNISDQKFQKYTSNELQNINLSNQNSNLFDGIENSLNITDYGTLNELNQDLSVTSEEQVNLTYYLDDVHNWKISKINASISNIKDKRNWVNNSGFQLPNIYRKYLGTPLETSHPYSQNNNPNPSSPEDSITESGATYIRAHFVNFSFEYNWDYMYVYDSLNEVYYVNDSSSFDIYTPWIPGDTIKFDYESDHQIQLYGYYIDYYEFVNDSSNLEVNSNWGFNYDQIGTTGKNYHGVGEIENTTAAYVATYADYIAYNEFSYEDNAFSEIYQNFTIPRKKITEAYVSFDYYCEFGLETNDNYIYVAINNQKIYSKGMGEIYDLGKRQWHKSGKITMDLWDNTTDIFDSDVENQDFNISIGFKVDIGWTYTNSPDGLLNFIWFDNISLVLNSIANSSQRDIMLKINSENLIEGPLWGESYLTLNGLWDSNPVILNLTTLSPSLTFDLNATLFGYHFTKTMINQQNDEGINYQILKNGTIIWKFFHNLYMPNQYSGFDVIIEKPRGWDFKSVLDPTLFNVDFEGGNYGNDYLKINKTYAQYPGWWTFIATSPNYLNVSNTKMLKQGQWVETSFLSGETTRIKTQINYSNEIPQNVELTEVNLTIYSPNGSIWYEETMNPYSNGTTIFSEITFTALNTIGGQYNYSLLWTNGTALGGIESNFIIYHNSSLTLLKPDDAKLDLRTAGFVGDIIPVRILLQDSENNLTISDSIISYNWTDGTRYFSEAALGIYETILDTADLASKGLYNILIESSKTGFLEANLTLEINLGEETNLQILDSDYNIELHANSTIKFNFTDFDGDGINGATINVSITNTSLYTIDNLGNGNYEIEFSTLYIDSIGIYQLEFSFTATNYEPQYYTYQFQIVEQSVNISINFNNNPIIENSLQVVTFYDEIIISARIISIIDAEYVTGGIITWISNNYELNLTESLDYWHNTSIIFNPNNFTFGINYIYLEFQHPNYKTKTFGFQLLVDQIEFGVDLVDFEDSIRVGKGGTLSLKIELLDPETSTHIENASVSYNWQYGVGALTEISPGIYQLILKLPENLQGNFNFKLIVSKEGTVYKATEFSFLLTIGEPGIPSFLIWLILIGATAIISVLGILSLRSYVIIPRKKKKFSKLVSRTQRYKDLRNIQAIVVIHRLSGIPLYSKSYSILEKQKKELFSGFIQAITTIGEEIAGKKKDDDDSSKLHVIEKIIELDFKYFDCLICDRGDIRIVIVLKEKASERLKEIINNFSMGLTLQLSDQIEDWDGSLDQFEYLIPPIVDNYIELYYKEAFEINIPEDIARIKKEMELNSMEIRILNVIYSMVKSKNNFYLEHVLDAVHEQNQDKIIDALESLIERKLIIPAKK